MPARFSMSRLETPLVLSLMRRSLDQTSTDFTDITDFTDACRRRLHDARAAADVRSKARKKNRGEMMAVFIPGFTSHVVAAFGRRGSLASV